MKLAGAATLSPGLPPIWAFRPIGASRVPVNWGVSYRHNTLLALALGGDFSDCSPCMRNSHCNTAEENQGLPQRSHGNAPLQPGLTFGAG